MMADMAVTMPSKAVLIVEDHPDMRELLVWQIELMGYTPVAASSAREALEKAAAEKPALILLDIMLPTMDGREAARMLKANPETEDIPILATTALFREPDLQSCLEAGCSGYLVKPFTFQELQRKLREFIPGSTH
jgi:twitching motility two-component system response regulator PilH